MNAPIHGAHGTLTLQANGLYSYVRDANAPGVNDVSPIRSGRRRRPVTYNPDARACAGNSVPGIFTFPRRGAGTLVDEAGLAGGSARRPQRDDPGTITFTSLDGVSKIELGSNVVTATTAASANVPRRHEGRHGVV